jgi:acyl-CoA synthetase (NDP forming)
VVIIGAGIGPKENRRYTDAIVESRQTSGKAILMINVPGFDSDYIPQFCNAGIPYFDSSERALKTYAHIRRYQQWRQRQI